MRVEVRRKVVLIEAKTLITALWTASLWSLGGTRPATPVAFGAHKPALSPQRMKRTFSTFNKQSIVPRSRSWLEPASIMSNS
ncbi:hypothetical protein F5882DRAFT_423762 [Hyaloscypha sp. PMI_1271]|nr:hypothetical protein F5882DRAFT_423762 [Hyaloscypha sp. PMI_1271]